MNYTSIEQSKKLLEFGLSPETSDMFWQSNLNNSDRQYLLNMGEEEYFDIEINFEHCSIGDYDIPAWSVGRLLELMPKLQSKEDEITGAKVVVNPFIGINSCCYINESNRIEFKKDGKTPIDAAYNMIVWLLENGYIKTEKK